jgi:squalene cyclase
MAFIFPAGTPEWLLAVCLVATIVACAFLSLAGPIRAAQTLVHAIAGLLRSCNEVRDEWGRLWHRDPPHKR